MIDLYGWIASIIMLVGGYGVAHKNRWGLVAFLGGNIGWAFIGYIVGLWSLFGVSVAFAAMDLYGLYVWSKK